jgi:phage shock protein A
MIQQSPNENDKSLNFDEAKTAIEKGFGSAIGTLGINNALLEKQLAASQQIVSKLTENEIVLIERIQDLEADIARLRHQLSNTPQPLSPEAAVIAADARAIIADGADEKEKSGHGVA